MTTQVQKALLTSDAVRLDARPVESAGVQCVRPKVPPEYCVSKIFTTLSTLTTLT